MVPPEGYLKEVADICKKHNVLFVCDEVQTGLGRTGVDLCHLRDSVRPDLVVLGKALAGGVSESFMISEQTNTLGRNVCALGNPRR